MWTQVNTSLDCQMVENQIQIHTSFRTEAKALVNIVVVGGGAPSVSIIPADSRAFVVRVPLEREGKLTSGTVSIATQGEEHCKAKRHRSCIKLQYRQRCCLGPAPSQSGETIKQNSG